jgi:hypothetical protein
MGIDCRLSRKPAAHWLTYSLPQALAYRLTSRKTSSSGESAVGMDLRCAMFRMMSTRRY